LRHRDGERKIRETIPTIAAFVCGVSKVTYRVPNRAFDNLGKQLERNEQFVHMLFTPNHGAKLSELVCNNLKHFVVIVDRLGQEWNQLVSSSLWTQGLCNLRERL